MEKNYLKELIDQGMSLNEISKKVNKSLTTIRYWSDKYNLKSSHKTFKEQKKIDMSSDFRVCSNCNVEQKSSFFYKKNNGKYSRTICKTCFSKICVEKWINKKIDAIIYKGSKCSDCQISYPSEPYVIFEFHHLNPENKEFDWSKMKLRSADSIKKELDKCVLLCSNCHKKRHHNSNLVVPPRVELGSTL